MVKPNMTYQVQGDLRDEVRELDEKILDLIQTETLNHPALISQLGLGNAMCGTILNTLAFMIANAHTEPNLDSMLLILKSKIGEWKVMIKEAREEGCDI